MDQPDHDEYRDYSERDCDQAMSGLPGHMIAASFDSQLRTISVSMVRSSDIVRCGIGRVFGLW